MLDALIADPAAKLLLARHGIHRVALGRSARLPANGRAQGLAVLEAVVLGGVISSLLEDSTLVRWLSRHHPAQLAVLHEGRLVYSGVNRMRSNSSASPKHARPIAIARERSWWAEGNDQVRCRDGQVHMAAGVGFGGDDLGPESSFIEVAGQGGITHGGRILDHGTDAEDERFGGDVYGASMAPLSNAWSGGHWERLREFGLAAIGCPIRSDQAGSSVTVNLGSGRAPAPISRAMRRTRGVAFDFFT